MTTEAMNNEELVSVPNGVSVQEINANLIERIKWATTKPDKPNKTATASITSKKHEKMIEEREWGNKMINQTNNGQWTTLLGESYSTSDIKEGYIKSTH